ncbi:DNA primase [Salinispira pacifica]|uniref:DNA primase n=1 Tax=Salinispira pacifica TaxID=1307761 RepID=V5WH48_9SPIO|nr:DNA primase [Salinispira pacifica]AHC15147.1 DNA primase [Salinispira pacifica]
MIPEETIEEVRRKTDIVEVVGEYVNLTRKGDRYWGLSPFKNEKTPSFTVTPSREMFYCFSTQKGGNVFTFIMEMEHLTFPEAVEYLGRRAGVEIDQDRGEISRESRDRKAMEELYAKIRESFSYLLTESDMGRPALDYIRNRGFDRELIDQFSLGYAHPDPFWLHGFLMKKGYSPEFLGKTGLFSQRNPRWCLFANRLMFPIQRHQGDTVGFGGRLLDGDGPKYINSPDTMIFHKKHNLYGLERAKEGIKKGEGFILCEGYLDVLAFHQAGLTNAVAPLGTAFTPEQAKLLHRFSTRGTCVFDGDEAGYKASQKAAVIFEMEGIECNILSLENDKDPADILAENGSQELKNLVHSATTALEFLVTKAVSKSDIHTPEGKERILEQLFPYIRSIQSPVKQEASLEILADRVSVTLESIRGSFQRFLRGERSPRPKHDEPGAEGGPEHRQKRIAMIVNPENLLMTALVIHPEYFQMVRKHIRAMDLRNDIAQSLYVLLEEHFRNSDCEFEKILQDIEHEEVKNFIMKKATSGEFGNDPAGYIEAALLRVRSDLLSEERREVVQLLKRKEQSRDSKGQRELLEKKMFLDTELKTLKESIHDRTAE